MFVHRSRLDQDVINSYVKELGIENQATMQIKTKISQVLTPGAKSSIK